MLPLSALYACASVLGIEDPEPREAGVSSPNGVDGAAHDGALEGSTKDGATSSGTADGSSGDTGATPTDGSADDTGTDAGTDADMEDDTGPPETCTGICVNNVPSGWIGPFAYSVTNGGGGSQPTPPACDGAYSTLAKDYTTDLNAPAAVCGCKCDPPAGVTCSAPTISLFSDGACSTSCAPANQAVSDTCNAYLLGSCGNKPKAKLSASAPDGGACSPKPSRTIPPRNWNTAVRLCSPSSASTGTCKSTRTCMPQPSLSQTIGGICVAATNDVDCPSGYPKKKVVYTDVTDNRDCTKCDCSDPAGGACAQPTVIGYDNPACSGATHPLTPGGTCDSNAGQGAKMLAPPVLTSAGSCSPIGGQPTGSAAPANATTICCTN